MLNNVWSESNAAIDAILAIYRHQWKSIGPCSIINEMESLYWPENKATILAAANATSVAAMVDAAAATSVGAYARHSINGEQRMFLSLLLPLAGTVGKVVGLVLVLGWP